MLGRFPWLAGAALAQSDAGPARETADGATRLDLHGELREWLQRLLDVEQDPAGIVARLLLAAAVLVLSVAAFLVTKWILLRGLRSLARKTRTQWDDLIVEARIFDRLAYVVPALIIHSGAGQMFAEGSGLFEFTRRVSLSFMILVGALVGDAVLNAVVKLYRSFEKERQRPIKSFAQLVKIAVYLVAAILILGTLMNRDPWKFLAGLGFLMGLVMLVFKDSILGFVGSIQLAANNMVRVGDWIELPKYGADGDVIDISLNTIKVQNWDKTISTVPTYALVANSFKNWRGMSESGGRRIKRTVHIDMNSVRFCDDEMIARFRQFELIKGYIDERLKEVEAFNAQREIDTSAAVNGRRLTNLGTFRRYVLAYLRSHEKIHQELTLLVRQLQPTEHGIPLEIYCFSSDKVWANYESIQADIFDHVLAVIPQFGLRVFQRPSGEDLRAMLREKASG